MEHRKLERMVAYAETGRCLRAAILRYFGDPDVRDPCGTCGSCRPHAVDGYERDLVRKVLAGIARAGERYGRRRIVAMLTGDNANLPPELTTLSTTGLLRHEGGEAVDGWLDSAIAAGLVDISRDKYRTLNLTPRGRDVMMGRLAEIDMPPPDVFRASPWISRRRPRRRPMRLDVWSI